MSRILRGFPMDGPATLVVQHMGKDFLAAFASQLDKLCAMKVRLARDGDQVARGSVLVAPGNFHLLVEHERSKLVARVREGPRVQFQRPSADVLFRSLASEAGSRSIGVILTGMGRDGADGLLEMRGAGAETLAQDPKSCVVDGMPRAAINIGAVSQVVSDREMTRAILDLATLPTPAAVGPGG